MIDRIDFNQSGNLKGYYNPGPGFNNIGDIQPAAGSPKDTKSGQNDWISAERPEGASDVFNKTGSSDSNVIQNSSYDKMLKRTGAKECQTCKNRKYQDSSNDPGVSFKSPTHISPANAGAAVSAHEQEHVRHEQVRANQENREVVYQSVKIYTAVCPECGKVYVSGGETTTVTASKPNTIQDKVGQFIDCYA